MQSLMALPTLRGEPSLGKETQCDIFRNRENIDLSQLMGKEQKWAKVP